MKNRRYICLIVIFIMFALSNSISSIEGILEDKSAKLELSLFLNDTILLSDSIPINIVFENKSNKNIVLYNWKGRGGTITGCLDGFLYFTIIHNKIDTLKYTSIYPIPKRPHRVDTIILSPHQKYEEEIILNSFYLPHSTINSNLNNVLSRRNWSAGNYSIQCEYQYTYNPRWKYGQDLWQGDVLSNKLNIIVK